MNRHRKDSDIICSRLRCFLDFSTQSSKELICNERVSIPLRPHSTQQRTICAWGWLPKWPEQRTEKPVHPGQGLKALPLVPNHLLNHVTTSTCCNKERGCAGSRQGESWRTSDDCIVAHFFLIEHEKGKAFTLRTLAEPQVCVNREMPPAQL